MRKYLLMCFIGLLAVAKVTAQDNYNERAKRYIAQYYPLAIAEQKRAGIPACITLGQGILETEAGASELMTQANNHFGIKCKNGWQGETFLHDDDERNECFKKYGSAEESFRDHSDHLLINPRYKPLFSLSPTDYASWAICLKKCGYATNPQYALQLIKIIEDFKLQEFTYSGLDSSILNKYAVLPQPQPRPRQNAMPESRPDTLHFMSPKRQHAAMTTTDSVKIAAADTMAKPGPDAIRRIADSAREMVIKKNIVPHAAPKMDTAVAQDTTDLAIADNHYDSSKIVTLNGLKAVYAYKGDMPLQYAVKYHIRYPRLLEMNDLPDAPLPGDMYIYLDKKRSAGTHADHVVQDGETLFMISQTEGVQLRKLMALNMLNPNEQPITGSTLQLQKQATERPEVTLVPIKAHKENAIITAFNEDPRQNDNYISIKRPVSEATDSQVVDNTPPQPETLIVPVRNTMPVENGAASEEKAEDLAALKADLDKVVYTDDRKLVKEDKPQPERRTAVAAQSRPMAARGEKYYTIKRGDTAFSIAKKNNISVDQLMEWNHITASGIKIGKKIQVRE